MPQVCHGCHKSYSTTGYLSHIRQTGNRPCMHAFRKTTQFASESYLFDGDPCSSPNPSSPILPDSPSGRDSHSSLKFFGDSDLELEDGGDLQSELDGDDDDGEGDRELLDLEAGWDGGDLQGELDGDDDDESDGELLELEDGWEPEPSISWELDSSVSWEMESDSRPTSPIDVSMQDPQPEGTSLAETERRLQNEIIKVPFGGIAGVPVESRELTGDRAYGATLHSEANPWAPFENQMEWEIARWAKLRGPSSTAFSELLKIPGVCKALHLSYRNAKELDKVIDEKLPGRPQFIREEVVIGGEAFEVYRRDVIQCIRALWSDPEFAEHLILTPERHYADRDKTIPVYHEMNTGKWWWRTQKAIERTHPGATVIPVIISSDKTQLTLFRNKTAYPIYMTLGNIPKFIRRKPSRHAYILLGYLPTAKLEHIANKAARRRTLANLFHSCVRRILEPLEVAGVDGVLMATGNGRVYRCHPVLAAYVGDYPEQLLVTGMKNGRCPTCPIPRDNLGDHEVGSPRDLAKILEALDAVHEGPTTFWKACREAGIKPIHQPFWQNLPYVYIFQSITPDVLHQLYQGIVKHLIRWLQMSFGETEINARCRRLPPNHNIRLFMKGITGLSRITGHEHDQICRFLLGVIVDLRLPNGQSASPLIRAVRGMLDFLFLAQYPVHTSETLNKLDAALQKFHDNKGIFITLGVRAHFNIPKLHSGDHYRMYIELFGTTDNYNTEYTERLHIDLAKEAYRSTNCKDEFPQMTAWLERREKIYRHEDFIQRTLHKNVSPHHSPRPPQLLLSRTLKMPKHPSSYVRLTNISHQYGAAFFRDALARYVAEYQQPINRPHLNARQIEEAAAGIHMPFSKVPVFNVIKFVEIDPYEKVPTPSTVDSIHVRPSREDKRGRIIPGRFDTALIDISNGDTSGVNGYCIGRVRLVFSIPSAAAERWFPTRIPPEHLAYIEWFSSFERHPHPDHLLYKVSPSLTRDGQTVSSIVPVKSLHSSIHLIPKFGPVAPRDWVSSQVLDQCQVFYANFMSDQFIYSTIY